MAIMTHIITNTTAMLTIDMERPPRLLARLRRRDVLLGALIAVAGLSGCKRAPERYELIYYYIPH